MLEVTESSLVTFPSVLLEPLRVRHWADHPDPVVRAASLSLHHQKTKLPRILDINGPSVREGIHLLPGWEGYRIVKLGQRRGSGDLFSRGGSAHNVTFCIAEVRNPKGVLVPIEVAVKTFSKTEDAFKEAVSNAIVLQRGFRSNNPMGLIADENMAILLSPLRKDVIPLDSESWDQFSSGDQEIHKYLLKKLIQIASLMADLHFKGINHSDPQFKNFWSVITDGNVEAFDWEAARIFQSPPSPEDLLTMSVDDLRVIFGSMNGQYKDAQISLLSGPLISRWELFRLSIFESYITRLEDNFINSGFLNESYLNSITQIENSLKIVLGVDARN